SSSYKYKGGKNYRPYKAPRKPTIQEQREKYQIQRARRDAAFVRWEKEQYYKIVAKSNAIAAQRAGAAVNVVVPYQDAQKCLTGDGGACATTAIGVVPGVGTGGRLAVKGGTKLAATTAARACSFTGTTTVLMGDGTKKPIEDIKVGDKVLATDPETGEQEARTVTHVWVHADSVVDLKLDGEVIATTEDHPFWSVTEQRFERADELGPGEQVLAADGRALDVVGLALASTRQALAYNLTVEGIHTYHVGDSEALVHNTCRIHGNSLDSPRLTTLYRLEDQNGDLLKWGITGKENPERRYTQLFMEDKRMIPIATGSRREMAEAERLFVEYWRGPLNRERWPVRGRG
ncbi:polymorphic toxin-type HINT domain-containing protein, partial [Knoellia sinensis]|uniref:polymorphic toxin-type HINT domain-containing protein n=1 Tax=Knoellia sinensis TaxID=136100 RepID=UPI0005699639